jgi:triacylglycerol lipase
MSNGAAGYLIGFTVSAGFAAAVLLGPACAQAAAEPPNGGGAQSSSDASAKGGAAPGASGSTPAADAAEAEVSSPTEVKSKSSSEGLVSSAPTSAATRTRPNAGPHRDVDGKGSSSTTVSGKTSVPDRQVKTAIADAAIDEPPAVPQRQRVDGLITAAVPTPEESGDGKPTPPPVAPAAALAVLASARPEPEHPSPKVRGAQTLVTAAATDPAPQALAASSIPPSDPADLQQLYVGQPTFFTQLVITGLKVVGAILRPFGGIVAFTGIKIPFITDGVPPFFATYGLVVKGEEFEGMHVDTLATTAPSGKYVVALHGGAYVAEASVFHWFTYSDLARETGATVVVPDYRLIPEGGTAAEAVPLTADLIAKLVTEHGAENVSVLGDSAGGGLAVAAVQELVQRGGNKVPGRMALLAPWLDVTMSDPLSLAIEDPLLTVDTLRADGTQWAGDLDPTNPIVSPLFGSLAGLPPTTVFSGSGDMLAADTLRLRNRVQAEHISNVDFVLRAGLIHDWPIFGFLPEAYTARPAIYRALLGG